MKAILRVFITDREITREFYARYAIVAHRLWKKSNAYYNGGYRVGQIREI